VGSSSKSYPPLAYNAVKEHALGLRSVLNDDLHRLGSKRRLYYKQSEDPRERLSSSPLTEIDLLGLRDDYDSGMAVTSSSPTATATATATAAAIANKWKSTSTLANAVAAGIVGMTAGIDNKEGDNDSGDDGCDVWTSWKSRRKQGVEKVVKNCIDYILYAPLDGAELTTTGSSSSSSSGASSSSSSSDKKVARTLAEISSDDAVTSSEAPPPAVGVRALGVLDLLTDDEVGPGFLPSPSYPSDHIAIAADIEIISSPLRWD
jgi:hypothetical protein